MKCNESIMQKYIAVWTTTVAAKKKKKNKHTQSNFHLINYSYIIHLKLHFLCVYTGMQVHIARWTRQTKERKKNHTKQTFICVFCEFKTNNCMSVFFFISFPLFLFIRSGIDDVCFFAYICSLVIILFYTGACCIFFLVVPIRNSLRWPPPFCNK